MTRDQDIVRVVDLKIPDQFLPSNYQAEEGQHDKPVKADDTTAVVQENISKLVGVKIPAMNKIKSSQPIPVQTDVENVDVKPSKSGLSDDIDGKSAQPIPVPINIENDDVKPSEPGAGDDIEPQTGTVQENISKLVGIKIPTIQNIISVPNNVESVKPSEANANGAMMPEEEFSANIPEEDAPIDKIEPLAPPPIIGDNNNSGGEDVEDVDIKVLDVVVPWKENGVFVDISAIVNVKIPTLPLIRDVTDNIDEENISPTNTTEEATDGFKCINGITISIDQVCVFID